MGFDGRRRWVGLAGVGLRYGDSSLWGRFRRCWLSLGGIRRRWSWLGWICHGRGWVGFVVVGLDLSRLGWICRSWGGFVAVGRDSSGFVMVGFDGVDRGWVGLARIGSTRVGPSSPSLVVVGVALVVVGLDSPGWVLQLSWFLSRSPPRVPLPSPPRFPLLTRLLSPSLAPPFPLLRAHIPLERGGAADAATSLLREPGHY